MNQFKANQTKSWVARVLGGAVLTALFMLVSHTASLGQTLSTAPNGIPPFMTNMANMLGVTPYALTTWNEAASAPKIQAAIDGLQPKVADGSASALEMLRYVYYNKVLSDITKYDIAVEVSMLKQLPAAHVQLKTPVPGPKAVNGGGGNSQLPSVYNSLVSIL